MTSIIKNQIIKHLSKFAKNLTPDQISLDVLKGKSELKNIVLNEEVLTEVLELPVWLRIRSATCNRVSVKIQWTKLKSAPVELFIDEIQVSIVLTADKPPPKKKNNALSAYSMDTGSYGFANKVVEGMSLYVNTLEIHFDSGAFGGSFMLSRLSVESRTPGWQQPNDLRQSRLTCSASSRCIVYKQVSWQLLRIEASAHGEGAQRNTINAPLRLITSNGRIRIALKKNSIDGSVLHARITMILEDILWVATLPQLQSAIAFYSHIMKLVQAAQGFAAPELPTPSRAPQSLAPTESGAGAGLTPGMKNTFRMFDFDQTSYHLHVKKIDLHLCDDAHNPDGKRADVYPPGWDIESGAMQVTLNLLLIDVYPRTVATSDRSHWVRYISPNPVTTFLDVNLHRHFTSLCQGLDETGRVRLKRVWPQLMSFNVVLRVFDMNIQCVSDMSTKRDALCNCFSSDRETKRNLPSDQFIVHVEFANFFHPMTDTLPVPPAATHAQIGPFSLLFDKRTIRWCLYVAHNLSSAFNQSDAPSMEPMPHTDLRVELLMPKLIIKLPDPSSDIRLPHRLVISLSTIHISNLCLDQESVFRYLDEHIVDYLESLSVPLGKDIFRSDLIQLNGNSPVSGLAEGEQFWIYSTPAWVETDHGERTKGLTLLSDVSFRAAACLRKEQVNIYAEPQSGLTLLVDHFQFLQLTRFSNELSTFFDQLAADQKFLTDNKAVEAPAVLIMLSLAQIKLHLMLTHGPLPSPYEACPAISERSIDHLATNGSFSDSESVAARDNTPPAVTATTKTVLIEEKRTIVVEEFPEFPNPNGPGMDLDLTSNLDETMSITTDISDDDANFVALDAPADDYLYMPAELAEEAVTADEIPENDRHYKSIMAKNVNIMTANLHDVVTFVNVFNQSTTVTGKVQSLDISQTMNKLRSDAYAELQATSLPPTVKISKEPPKASFVMSVPADSPEAHLQITASSLNLQLDDEIVSHLSPFILDEEMAESKTKLEIRLQDTVVEISDKKKKKPMRLILKDAVIEQDAE